MPYIYPTSAVMKMIEPDLIQEVEAGRIGLQLMPVENVNAAKVRWTQEDNYYGLQHMRGMDGMPVRVQRVGEKMYEYEPGVFGEFFEVTETELTNRAGSIDPTNVPIDVTDLVTKCKRRLLMREAERKETSIWTLLTTGTLKIIIDDPNGMVYAYNDSYTIQTYTPSIPWSTLATATPITNFQAVQQLGMAAGHSVNFGAGATAYMNTVTANYLLNNANASDIAGRRNNFGATYNSLADMQTFWNGQGLPKMVVYDNGYIPTKGGTFTKYIPNGKVVVIGQRPSGAAIGNYQITRNASANYQAASYEYVLDRANGNLGSAPAEKKTPANIEVHRGHNGGPVILYPSAVLVMTVA